MRPSDEGEVLTLAGTRSLLPQQRFNYKSHKQLASQPETGVNSGSVPNFDSIGRDGRVPKPCRTG
jgi:hypothetical protein